MENETLNLEEVKEFVNSKVYGTGWKAIGGGEIVEELYYDDKNGEPSFIGELWGSNGTREEAYKRDIFDKSDDWFFSAYKRIKEDGLQCVENNEQYTNRFRNTSRRRKS